MNKLNFAFFVSSIILLSGCSIIKSDNSKHFNYNEKSAEVIRSTYVDEFCMDTTDMDRMPYYHKDLKDGDFFNSIPKTNIVPKYKRFDYDCRRGAYKTKVVMLDVDIRGSRYIEVMTKDKYRRGEKIKIMVKEYK